MRRDIVLAIVGSGGDGVISAGEILARAAAHEGLNVFLTKSYGPQIRGGESSCRIRLSHDEILSPGDCLDVLFVFQWQDFHRFVEEYTLAEDCAIFVDEYDNTPESEIPIPKHLIPRIHKIPFEKIAEEKAGTKLAKNMALIGSVIELINWPEKAVNNAVEEKFKRKGEEVLRANLTAIETARLYVREHFSGKVDTTLQYEKGEAKLFMTGNEALCFGALLAGCRFYAGYPITPASEILEWFSTYMPKFGGTVMQAEDEIAAVGMAIGASYAGVKAMCGTSGPGMSLKTEMIGLASMAEIPLVVVDVQRTGPSTGIPTRTEQADLQIAVYGGHGDAPRAVLAPVDVEDCFFTAIDAFNIAEKFQLPVIILSDQFISQRKEAFPSFNGLEIEKIYRDLANDNPEERYQRYALVPNGISPTAIPGMPNHQYTAVGIEHDPIGNPSSTTQMHIKMSEKRAKKLLQISEEHPLLRTYGPEDADIALMGWGSTKGILKEIVKELCSNKLKVKCIIPRLLHPLPVSAISKALTGVSAVIFVEQSYSHQFYRYIRAHLDLPENVYQYSRAGGIPLTVGEVISFIKSALSLKELQEGKKIVTIASEISFKE